MMLIQIVRADRVERLTLSLLVGARPVLLQWSVQVRKQLDSRAVNALGCMMRHLHETDYPAEALIRQVY